MVVARKQVSQNMVCRFMRYREIPASGAAVCRKGGIDYNVPRHEYLYKLCTIPQDYSKPAFLENGQPKDAAIAAQRQHFHIQPKNRTCKLLEVNR